MSETNPKRLAMIKTSRAAHKKRKRSASLHVALTESEREEFRRVAEEHGLLDRELVMNAVRTFETAARRLGTVEARLTLLEDRLEREVRGPSAPEHPSPQSVDNVTQKEQSRDDADTEQAV